MAPEWESWGSVSSYVQVVQFLVYRAQEQGSCPGDELELGHAYRGSGACQWSWWHLMNWDLSSRWKAPSSARSLGGCLYGLNFLLEHHGIDSICPWDTVREKPADACCSLPVPSLQGHQPEIQGGSMLPHGCCILSEQRRHSPYSIQCESRLGSAAKQKSRELVLRVPGYRSQYEVSPFPPLRGVWLRDGDIRHDFIHPKEGPCADWEQGSLCPSLPMVCLIEDIVVFPYIFFLFFSL